jgi:hypothetical protein
VKQRHRKRRLPWLDRALHELVASLEEPAPERITREEIEALWKAWNKTSDRLDGLPSNPTARATQHAVEPLRLCLNAHSEWARGLVALLSVDGMLRFGEGSFRAAAVRPAVELLDHAMKSGRPAAVLRQLRRCSTCNRRRFFVDPKGQAKACAKCRDRRRQEVKRTVVARMEAAKRASAHRERKRLAAQKIDAPPGKCRSQDLLTSPGWGRRVRFLMEQHGKSREAAGTIAQLEAERSERVRSGGHKNVPT